MVKRFGIIAGALLMASGIAGVMVSAIDSSHASLDRTPAQDPFDGMIAPYPGTVFLALGTPVEVDRIERTLAYATTDDSVSRVANFYDSAWRREGLHVEHRISEHEEWLTATQPFDPLVRTVIATETDSHTTVIASLRDLTRERVPVVAPVAPGCVARSSTAATDQGVATHVLLLDCQTPIDALVRHYDQRFSGGSRRGFVEPTIDRKEAYVHYAEATSALTLLARQTREAPARTAATITWQEQR